MAHSQIYLCLDVGERRIGVARGDSAVRIAVPLETIDVTDGQELQRIARLAELEHADALIIGYPRNQSGEPTAQTAYVEAFVGRLQTVGALPIIFQDESLTSVIAEQRLQAHNRPYKKGDIDMHAAAIILQDYLEQAL
jgi:putative Holliday junction resolvase